MENLERAYNLIDILVSDYFSDAVMPYECAFAFAELARIHIEIVLGIDLHERLFEQYDELHDDDYGFMIFPDDEKLRIQIDELEELLAVIEGGQDSRNVLIRIKQKQALRLIYSRPVEK